VAAGGAESSGAAAEELSLALLALPEPPLESSPDLVDAVSSSFGAGVPPPQPSPARGTAATRVSTSAAKVEARENMAFS
jgi:hypothetical protein